jgi:hypothetical protein
MKFVEGIVANRPTLEFLGEVKSKGVNTVECLA